MFVITANGPLTGASRMDLSGWLNHRAEVNDPSLEGWN
jgi:hypothetical protein